jgi:hypothetical protein
MSATFGPRPRRLALARHAGVVLPVVLVILTVLTGLVVSQVRRGTIDERLAANTRESVMLDDAAQTVLRFCEFRVVRRPQNTATANAVAGVAAWNVPANWTTATSSLDFTGLGLTPGGGAIDPACVIEDATCELQAEVGRGGPMPGAGCNGINHRWRKFRITSRVQIAAPDLPAGVRQTMSQSEVRLLID